MGAATQTSAATDGDLHIVRDANAGRLAHAAGKPLEIWWQDARVGQQGTQTREIVATLSERLIVPANITLLTLPPYSPELNPVENVRQNLRSNWLSSAPSATAGWRSGR